MYKKIIFLLSILLVSGKIFPQSAEDKGLNSITKEKLLATDTFLASDELGGRLPGSEGFNEAAKYMSEKFMNFDLIPKGDDGYFQYFNIEYNQIDTPAVLNLHFNDTVKVYKLGKDFVLRGFTGSGNLLMPVVFCGYGITDTSLGYDDYNRIDVKNKVVIVFKQNPHWQKDGKTFSGELPREKSLNAKKHGAKGILFVSLPNDEHPQPLIGSVLHGEGEQPVDFPQLHISIDAANDFLSNTGYLLKDLQTRIDETQKPFSFNLFTRAEIFVNAHYQKDARTMNVVGMLPGTDSLLQKEYVIIGAHLDHVGTQAGLLFPGANDNASGSSALLSIAEAFTESGLKPKRSILFVFFAGEEQGLNGSTYFADHMKIKPDKIAAMINLDCVGYGDSIKAGNGKSAPVLWDLVKDIDEGFENMLVSETWSGGGADATPFHNKGIPCLYFVTTNSYDHLHLPSDKTQTLNGNLFENVTKLAYLTARSIADGKYKREVLAEK